MGALAAYLAAVHSESVARGYAFADGLSLRRRFHLAGNSVHVGCVRNLLGWLLPRAEGGPAGDPGNQPPRARVAEG